MKRSGPGTLIIVGGHEDKTGDKEILRHIADHVGDGKMVIATVASSEPEGLFETYESIFRSLGVRHIHKLWFDEREEARTESKLRILDDATAVFFTGGDQIKLTSQIGDTPIFQRLHDIFHSGGLIAGTSAGASAMSETMLASGSGDQSAKSRGSVNLAPGLGLVGGVVIDQHFAERGRLSRLLAAVALNPKLLGVGIDEDTAIILERRRFVVVGNGAVYVLDGSPVTTSNAADSTGDSPLSIFDVTLHVLAPGDSFEIEKRRPGKVGRRTEQRLLDGAVKA